MPISTLKLPVETWQMIMEEVYLLCGEYDGRQEFGCLIRPVCKLFDDIGVSVMYREHRLNRNPDAHQLASALGDETSVYYRHQRHIRALGVYIHSEEFDGDSNMLASYKTILSKLKLRSVVFATTGMRDELAECFRASSHSSLRDLAVGIQDGCFKIVDLLFHFSHLSSLILGCICPKTAFTDTTNNFQGFAPLRLPTVTDFSFYWLSTESTPEDGLISYVGSSRFAPSCDIQIHISYIALDPGTSSLLDPLFAAHKNNNVTIDLWPFSLPTKTLFKNAEHIFFDSTVPDIKLFETDTLPPRITFEDSGTWDLKSLCQVLDALLRNPGMFNTVLQVSYAPTEGLDPSDAKPLAWSFSRDYNHTQPWMLHVVGVLTHYALRLAAKGIVIVDSDAMSLEGCRVVGPMKFLEVYADK